MVEIIYGTRNAAKLAFMQKRLSGLDEINFIGLNELGEEIPDIEESGGTPIENAWLKAKHYYDLLKRPVFSADSGLYFDGVPDRLQPGLNIRRVNGRRLSDAEMIEYYSRLAEEFGKDCGFGKCLAAQYVNGIVLFADQKNIFAHMGEDIAGEKFYLSSAPHAKREEGFPLDSLSLQMETGKYFFDLEGGTLNILDRGEGFKKFFYYALFTSPALR